jgi:hypothetical protein
MWKKIVFLCGMLFAITNILAAPATGPLRALASNPHYFGDASGKAILLVGSHTWNDLQDFSNNNTPVPIDFTAYVRFLKAHNHNATILWRKDLPMVNTWGAGGVWRYTGSPWQRTGPGKASDSLPKFDLTKFDQAWFDRLRARTIQLGDSGIYAIIELFDCGQLYYSRYANDGYPFTGNNNVNGVDDGGGINSINLTIPAITAYQDSLVKKTINALNDLDNVLWEVQEEGPPAAAGWCAHMITLIKSYEAGKPKQHPVGYPVLTTTPYDATDAILYNSNADWVAPYSKISPTSTCGTGTPACKVNISDSDHSYYGIWNDTPQLQRNWIWENFANGNQFIYMDPYLISWPNRNSCGNTVGGVCSSPDTSLRHENVRYNMGYTLKYANKMNLAAMTPQPSLSSTGYCLANAGSEYLAYAPTGGTFTVTLAAGMYNVEWFNPSNNATSAGTAVSGGAARSFTPLFSGDAVLYLKSQGLKSDHYIRGLPLDVRSDYAIYDIAGRVVMHLKDTDQRNVEVRIANLANGLYFAKATAGATRFIKKMVVHN